MPPFPRITYAEAIDILQKNGHPEAKVGDDFGGDEETVISVQVRPPGHRPPLPHRPEGLLLQARPERRQPGAQHGRARARGIRRDHRRRAARGRPRQARGRDRPPQAAARAPSSGTSTCGATARSRTRASASGSSARWPWIVRAAPRARDHPVPADAQPPVALAAAPTRDDARAGATRRGRRPRRPAASRGAAWRSAGSPRRSASGDSVRKRSTSGRSGP